MEKIKALREKYLPYNEKTLRTLSIIMSVMYIWILVWALILKMCNSEDLIRNYEDLGKMSTIERIMWDIIPFYYSEAGRLDLEMVQIVTTILNSLVLAPFGVALNYIFKKKNILRDAALCFSFVILIETTQLFTLIGNPATEDIITNFAGYFIGLGIYYAIFRRLSTKSNVRIFAVTSILCTAIFVYSIITTIGSAELLFKLLTRTY